MASLMAEFGLLRLSSMLNISVFQTSKILEQRLKLQELQILRSFHYDGKGLRTALSELMGLKDWLESFKGFRKLNCPIILISGKHVEKILDDSKAQKEWSEIWNKAQSDYIKDTNGELFQDSECDSMSLCVSNQIKPAISSILKRINK